MQKVVKEDATSSPVSASEVKITQDTVEVGVGSYSLSYELFSWELSDTSSVSTC